jgi:predicted metalloprotease
MTVPVSRHSSAGPSGPRRPQAGRAALRFVLTVAVVAALGFLLRSTGTSGSVNAGGGRPGAELVRTHGKLSATVAATNESLRAYWSKEMPRVYGRPFRTLAGGLQAKTPSSSAWTCGGRRYTFADVKGNAFYCRGAHDDYIAYDAASLLPQLDKQFGSLTPSVVLAHEMGHAVQARAGVHAPSVVMELQADCFAGAWVAFAQHSTSDRVTVPASALDASVRAIPALRDQPGTPASNPGAHGLGFDRVNAYQTGYERGAERCATFPRGHVTVTELPFTTVTEAQTGGDLPYADTVRFAVDSLDAFWPAALARLGSDPPWRHPRLTPVRDFTLPGCRGDEGYDQAAVAALCAPTNTIAWSDPLLLRLHDSVGDVAAASALSLAWARSGQVDAGWPSTGSAARLQQVCFTGAWLSALASHQSARVTLSPGDIDESLFAVLTPLSPAQVGEVRSSSFERADAFRRGLLSGLAAC